MYVKIIDQAGEEIGCIDKKYLLPLGLRHQIARVIVYARNTNTVLLQQRSLSDTSCPGMWDTSASGHVDGHEILVHAALRELKEELDITATDEALHFVGSFDTSVQLDQGRLERQTYIYCLELPEESNDFTANPAEVEKATWIDLEECTLGDQSAAGVKLTKGAAQALQLFKDQRLPES